MKKSAVEWLAEQIEKTTYLYNEDKIAIKQAKELEKEQLKECWRKAQEEQRKEFSSSYSSIKFDEWFKNYKNDNKGV